MSYVADLDKEVTQWCDSYTGMCADPPAGLYVVQPTVKAAAWTASGQDELGRQLRSLLHLLSQL